MEYTYNSLRSLLEHTGMASYEVILVDDGSTDDTPRMLSKIQNILSVRNETNLGFAKACNKGSLHAKGEYLVFLNNDTEVFKDWLTSLVKLANGDETAGAVGGKLLFPDGTLQEAGSIIWSNGSTLGFGRGENPNDPEFCYVREVDFCSAAFLLVRTDIFLRLGGFDEIYSPAYYEDADLCMGIKSLGYRVMFHPDAKVTHYEYGTNLKARAVQLSLDNRGKFVEKWNERIEKQFAQKPENILFARDCRTGSRVWL